MPALVLVAAMGLAAGQVASTDDDRVDEIIVTGERARRSLEGALSSGPAAALSGPVARGDGATLERHRTAIDAWDPARRALYDALVAEQERLVARRAR